MKKITLILLPVLLVSAALLFAFKGKNTESPETKIISFYEVPLVCGADPDIGCGSRVKPLFIETAKENKIKESWLNRQGTLMAIVWDEQFTNTEEQEKLIQPLFAKFQINAVLITDSLKVKEITGSMNESGKWLQGMDVDKLSLEEAETIAESLTALGKSKGLLNDKETGLIKAELEDYFKKELVKVRTYDELKNRETQDKWQMDGYKIFEKHIGSVRADKIAKLYEEESGKEENMKSCEEDCCKKK